MPPAEMAAVALIGLIAGTLGGLAGVGGSIFILPALHIVFSPAIFGESRDPQIHHLYMAAGMTVNVAVAVPSAIQHYRAGVVRTAALPVLLIATSLAVLVGVQVSNLFSGETLRLLLASFLTLYCAWNLRMIARPRRRKFTGEGRIENHARPRLAFCGATTGLLGGVLGLGGGFLMVPLLQLVCNFRLKNAIATSSAVLCLTSAIGAVFKMVTLPSHGETVGGALVYAGLMAPAAVIGALTGARLLHHLPVVGIRLVMTLLILIAATRLF